MTSNPNDIRQLPAWEKAERIADYLAARAGQFVAITSRTEVKTDAAHKENRVERLSAWTGRGAIDYENLKDTAEAREKGLAPGQNAGLPWGVWHRCPLIIEHKGAPYVRLYEQTEHRRRSTYSVDGVQVERSKVADYITAGAWAKMNEPSERATHTMALKVASLLTVGELIVND